MHYRYQVKAKYEGFQILTAMIMKRSIFWDITLCSPLKGNRLFRGTWRALLGNCFMLISSLAIFLHHEEEGDGLNVYIRNFYIWDYEYYRR
jgi:hypothetical protein